GEAEDVSALEVSERAHDEARNGDLTVETELSRETAMALQERAFADEASAKRDTLLPQSGQCAKEHIDAFSRIVPRDRNQKGCRVGLESREFGGLRDPIGGIRSKGGLGGVGDLAASHLWAVLIPNHAANRLIVVKDDPGLPIGAALVTRDGTHDGVL